MQLTPKWILVFPVSQLNMFDRSAQPLPFHEHNLFDLLLVANSRADPPSVLDRDLSSDPSTFHSALLLHSTSTMQPPLHILLAVLLLFSSLCSYAAADDTDTLTAAGRALAVGDKLVSRNGKFALGFFQFQPTTASATDKSRNSTTATKNSGWYLGIWFNKVPLFTAVWIANREEPIAADDRTLNLTVQLKVSTDGNLVIAGAGGESAAIWSTHIGNTSIPTNATTMAVLLDSGNFVLTSSDGMVVLWQSFDHPTDVFLPGSKFSRNKVTGAHSHAISRRSLIDPGLGSYSAELDTSGVVLRSRDPSVVYWSFGTGASPLQTLVLTVMGLIPQTRDFVHPMYVDNDEEEYYMYTSPESAPPTFVSLDISGHIQMNLWSPATESWQAYTQPADACTPFATCGPFTVCNGANARLPCNCMEGFSRRSPPDWELGDRTGGCIRDTPLHCTSSGGSGSKNTTGSTDVFHAIARVTLPYDPQSVDAATSQSECEEACLGSCSCVAYSYNNSRCSVWNGELLSVNLNDGVDNNSEDVLYLRLDAGDSPSSTTKTRRKPSAGAVTVASVISVGSLILLLLLVVIWRNRFRWCGSSSYENQGGIIAFRYTDLVRATKNFSDKLGAGGFGSVYRGVLSDSTSTSIAVKRLDGVRQGEKQFRAEVSSIGLIQHINLVKLIGFCCEGDNRLLVYEHMVNGSLEGHLFKTDAAVLDWKTRHEIALGVARGLSYLHQSCCECIIHCDIKPENVLLDASFAPKVADFGMAAFVGRDFSRILTTFRGTAGYLAPEWLSGVAITPKIDVYGFGMVLMEIISGRRNSPETYTSSSYHLEYFPVQAIGKLRGGDFQSLVDPRLDGEFDLEQAKRVCKVACWCIQDSEFNRPAMGDVVRILEGLQDIEMPPMPRLLAAMMEQSDTASM